jgi:hypothetical protein
MKLLIYGFIKVFINSTTFPLFKRSRHMWQICCFKIYEWCLVSMCVSLFDMYKGRGEISTCIVLLPLSNFFRFQHSNKIVLALAITVILGFGSRRDLCPHLAMSVFKLPQYHGSVWLSFQEPTEKRDAKSWLHGP